MHIDVMMLYNSIISVLETIGNEDNLIENMRTNIFYHIILTLSTTWGTLSKFLPVQNC